MSPRPYQLGKRQTAVAQTRERILHAARDTILDGSGFSMDEVARRADVARMTLYYQFGSRRGLIEGLFDHVADEGLARALPQAFSAEEPLETLRCYVRAFTDFWEMNFPLIRRLLALSVLDPDLAQSVRDRDDRRRRGAGVIMERLTRKYARPQPRGLDRAADVLYSLTSFGFFGNMAEKGQSAKEIAEVVYGLILAHVGLEPRATRRV